MCTDMKAVAEALLNVLDGTTRAHDLVLNTGMDEADAEAIMVLRSELMNDRSNNRGLWENKN